jgi:hypothetical protein
MVRTWFEIEYKKFIKKSNKRLYYWLFHLFECIDRIIIFIVSSKWVLIYEKTNLELVKYYKMSTNKLAGLASPNKE